MMEKENNIDKAYQSFFTSLAWVVVIITCEILFSRSADVINVDFLHTNPHRTQSSAASMIFTIAPFIFIITLFGIALTFSFSQFVQAFLAKKLMRKYGTRGLYSVVLSVPLVAVLSWYCYDYLTPSGGLGINCGPEWRPYEHGITMDRYLIMLGIQSFVTLLSISRLTMENKRLVTKIYLLLVWLGCASIIGFIHGFMTAHIVQ